MSKGKDFRGPKKRGFDDDGPSPYDSPRPMRPTRSGGGMPGGMSPDVAPAGPPVDAMVKWFKSEKGFGFVEVSEGGGDAFLHIGVLHAAGYETVPPGAKLKVHIGTGLKGAQVTRVLEVDTAGAAERASQHGQGEPGRPQRRMPDPSTAVAVTGTVKWFDDHKGFGFVECNDGGKDVFVHISILGPSGIQSLAEGQPVTMQVVDTPKGREALSISLN